jgi:hypothetical protein
MFSYTQWALDWLSKAAGHKYIKRVPYQSGGRTRYRYIYNVTHTHQGKHVLDPTHMKVGTKLMLDATSGAEVHGHIQSVSGDQVTFVYDDGPKKGESVTMSKDKLATELDKVHGISSKLDAARKKQSDIVAKLKENNASAKQIARAEARLKALGGDDRESVPTIDDQQDDPASPPNARDIADYLAEQFDNEDGYSAKVWTLDHRTRVYVRRKLVSGWQDMGYFDIDTRGNVTTNFSRNKAGMRQKAETYLREMLS